MTNINTPIVNQQTLFSFFYPNIKRRKLKKMLNITKEYNFKRFNLYKKFATSYELKIFKLQKKK